MNDEFETMRLKFSGPGQVTFKTLDEKVWILLLDAGESAIIEVRREERTERPAEQ